MTLSPQPAISVIVPCHNSQSTIEHTLRSLASQPDTPSGEIEFVIVLDYPDDSTPETVERLVKELPGLRHRAVVIKHDRNRGAAQAQASGMLAARGKWLGRVDADDYVSPGYFSNLLHSAQLGNALVAVAPMAVETGNCKPAKILMPENLDDLNSLTLNTVNFSLANKLFHRSVVSGPEPLLPVEGMDCWDDLSVVARVLALRPTIAYTGTETLYHYTILPEKKSLSRTAKEKILADHIACARMIESWMKQHDLTSRYTPFLNRLKFISKVKYLRGHNRDVRAWKETFPEVNSLASQIGGLPIWQRLAFMTVDKLPAAVTSAVAKLMP